MTKYMLIFVFAQKLRDQGGGGKEEPSHLIIRINPHQCGFKLSVVCS